MASLSLWGVVDMESALLARVDWASALIASHTGLAIPIEVLSSISA
jgi:hypothetical protein